MNKKRHLRGYTLIEIIISLTIASAFSVGLYSVFVEGTKGINREEVLTDVKNYVTNSLDLIVSDMQSAEQIDIESYLGSNVIILNSKGQSEIRYSIINNLICKNEVPIKLPGHHWLSNNQGLYEADIEMICDGELYGLGINPTKTNIINSLYDIEIVVDVESKIDDNYKETYRAHNRVFAINKFSLL